MNNEISWSKEERDDYDDARGIYIQDERGRLEYAVDEGKKIGLDEGKKIGVEEGRKKRELEIARELKKNGANIDLIMSSTGLTKEEIENL